MNRWKFGGLGGDLNQVVWDRFDRDGMGVEKRGLKEVGGVNWVCFAFVTITDDEPRSGRCCEKFDHVGALNRFGEEIHAKNT